ncbi:MAG: IS1182 family transposase [Bacteroidota bacterium]
MQSKFKSIQNDQLFLLPPNIEDFIPEGHLARVISEIVDTFDTRDIEGQYSYQGQKSYHPKILIKLWVYGYATGTLSGRKIAMKCETDTAYMYLSSMYRPDFRTINDFRKDNIKSFEGYFIAVIKLCRELGMASVGTITLDGTKIRANASAKQMKDKAIYSQWLKQVEGQLADLTQQADAVNVAEEQGLTNQRGDEIPKEIRKKEILVKKIQQAIEDLKDRDGERRNLTDKDVRLVKSGGQIKPNYNCQGAVTQDGIIVAAYVSNNASDKEQLAPLVNQAEQNTGKQVENILADSGYASYANYEWIEQQQKTAYIPDQEYEHRDELKAEPYDRSNFIYDPEKDNYTCPQGKELIFDGIIIDRTRKQKLRIYKGTQCSKCPVKSDCTSGKARQINKDIREPLREKARNLLDSPQGKLIYRQRMTTIEPIWGNIKFNKKITMFHLRGLTKVNGEWMLIAIGNNIQKLMARKEKLKVAA